MKQYEDFVVPEYIFLMCTFYHNTDLILRINHVKPFF